MRPRRLARSSGDRPSFSAASVDARPQAFFGLARGRIVTTCQIRSSGLPGGVRQRSAAKGRCEARPCERRLACAAVGDDRHHAKAAEFVD